MDRDEEAFYRARFTLIEEVPLRASTAMRAGVWLRTVPERTEPLLRDALIAARALERGEPVLTRNVRDFGLFPDVHVETY
jgi:predicted nucleic acid-binding protein